jgi:hypothetical protein
LNVIKMHGTTIKIIEQNIHESYELLNSGHVFILFVTNVEGHISPTSFVLCEFPTTLLFSHVCYMCSGAPVPIHSVTFYSSFANFYSVLIGLFFSNIFFSRTITTIKFHVPIPLGTVDIKAYFQDAGLPRCVQCGILKFRNFCCSNLKLLEKEGESVIIFGK